MKRNRFTVEQKPDRKYGMSYPYKKLFDDGIAVLEKLPFSPWLGKIQADKKLFSLCIGTRKETFSIRVWIHGEESGENRRYEGRKVKTISAAYLAAKKIVSNWDQELRTK